MCVIFFYVNSNPGVGGYKLILASNRDEFYERKTQTAAKWANAEHVYGGIDMEKGREGGTWLAIGGKNGIIKVGALLNLTGEPKPRNAVAQNNFLHCKNNILQIAVPLLKQATKTTTSTLQNDHFLLGRGMIVADFVNSLNDCSIDEYNHNLVADCTKYSAFNFVSIEIGATTQAARITHCSNVPPNLNQYEERKCYGFGNSLPDTPFKKVQFGKKRFEEIVNNFVENQHTIDTTANAQQKLTQDLLELLKCKHKFWPDVELNRRAPNWGEHLSAINVNIAHEAYGSRTHTVILVDNNNVMHFIEETMADQDPAGEWLKTHIEKSFA